MKRWISFAIVLALVALLPAAVLAKPVQGVPAHNKIKTVVSEKLTLYHVDDGSSDYVDLEEPYKGHCTVTTPKGKHDLIIHGVISGLKTSTEYAVWVRQLTGYTGYNLDHVGTYYKLVLFKTDAEGHGNWHLKIADADLPAGSKDLQIAINEGGTTVAATQKWLTVEVN